jgi:hypothetical protein
MACTNSSREKRVLIVHALNTVTVGFYYDGFVKCATKYGPTISIVNILIWNNHVRANCRYIYDLFMPGRIYYFLITF